EAGKLPSCPLARFVLPLRHVAAGKANGLVELGDEEDVVVEDPLDGDAVVFEIGVAEAVGGEALPLLDLRDLLFAPVGVGGLRRRDELLVVGEELFVVLVLLAPWSYGGQALEALPSRVGLVGAAGALFDQALDGAPDV